MTEHQNSEYLFHYTDIDSLALILKHRTIRLNSLDRMDDLQEQDSIDKQNFGRFVFVSSWTSDFKESIPMWRMYTPTQRGIRIKLRKHPFKEYIPTSEEATSIMEGKDKSDSNITTRLRLIVPLKDLLNDSYTVHNYVRIGDSDCSNQLFKVEYTNDSSLLKPSVMQVANGDFNVNLSKIGKYKNKYWSFQNEWRYILNISPISTKKLLSNYDREMGQYQLNVRAGISALPINYFDLVIDDRYYSEMEVTLSPDINESSRTFTELLKEKYNPTMKITESSLAGLIR